MSVEEKLDIYFQQFDLKMSRDTILIYILFVIYVDYILYCSVNIRQQGKKTFCQYEQADSFLKLTQKGYKRRRYDFWQIYDKI